MIPSLPGFGFSGPTTRAAAGNRYRTARAWAELMAGSATSATARTATTAARWSPRRSAGSTRTHVIGVHVTQLFSFPSGDPAEFEGLSEADSGAAAPAVVPREQGRLQRRCTASSRRRWRYALADSPVGLLGWNAQLFGDELDDDFVLTNVAHLLADQHRPARRSASTTRTRTPSSPNEPTTVPTGLAMFACDFRSIRRFAERDHANIVSWHEFDRGSHWATQDAQICLLCRTSGSSSPR